MGDKDVRPIVRVYGDGPNAAQRPVDFSYGPEQVLSHVELVRHVKKYPTAPSRVGGVAFEMILIGAPARQERGTDHVGVQDRAPDQSTLELTHNRVKSHGIRD